MIARLDADGCSCCGAPYCRVFGDVRTLLRAAAEPRPRATQVAAPRRSRVEREKDSFDNAARAAINEEEMI